MKKQTEMIVIAVVLLLILTGGISLVYRSKKNETANKDEVVDIPIIEVNETIEPEEEPLAVETLLAQTGPIVKLFGGELVNGTILWSTKDDQLELQGRGYLLNKTSENQDLREKYNDLLALMQVFGFEYDEYNIGSLSPGYERITLKMGSIICEVYIREDESIDPAEMGILCAELTEEAAGGEVEPMSEKRARSIAETSGCTDEGALKDTAFYNENTKTWWIDLEIEKEGCNPACVVNEDETTEINWRCTGLNK